MRLEGDKRSSLSGVSSAEPLSPGVLDTPGFPVRRDSQTEPDKRERPKPTLQRLASTIAVKTIRQQCIQRQSSVPASSLVASGSPAVSRAVSTDAVLKRHEDITKSESDKREYRALVLMNNMKVILVSDRTAETAAAALQVNVGSFSDPDEVPGLAHFCEHMTLMGTEKYPEENAFEKFLSEHGGWSNASTSGDYTEYHFCVLPDHLGACLDIFAQFFICPLFTESATDRELNAVDSEFQNTVCSDGRRLQFVDTCGAQVGHACRKFGIGNRYTLETAPKEKGINVRQELLDFHRRWYSAGIMSLAVVGKESLDDLEAMVVPLFLPVEDRGVEAPAWPTPFPPSTRGRRTYAEPIADIRNLNMEFPIPTFDIYYPGDPFVYLSHLVGHEGPGSLLSLLKTKGWCNSLMGGESYPVRSFAHFGVSVDLTEDGVEHTEDIVSLTFQYLAMLRAHEPQRAVWEEMRALFALSFRFVDSPEPLSLALALAGSLQTKTYPIEDILIPWRSLEWRPELIKEALNHLTPENVRIQIVAKCFADKCTQIEPWYGTKYLEEDIEPHKIKEWQLVTPNPEFHIPPPNEFVPSKLDLEERVDPTCEDIAPAIIRDTPFMRLWYKQDNEFLLPKASIEFEFSSPLPDQSPRNSQLTTLWCMLVEDSLQETTYMAELAGLAWGMHYSNKAVYIYISGYDDKQHMLLQLLVEHLVTFTPDPRRFAVMQEIIVRNLKNLELDQPHEHADHQIDVCLAEQVLWTAEQYLNAVEKLTPKMLEDYIQRFLRSVYVEGIAFGNLSRDRALQLADIVQARIPSDADPLLAQDLLNSRALEIEKGRCYLREIENPVHTSSCTTVYLQCGVLGDRDTLVLQLMGYMLTEPCFDTLRTKEQLGYIVSCGGRGVGSGHGFHVTVQGDHDPIHLEQRIEAFLHTAQDYLEAMSSAEFSRHRDALVALRAEKPRKLQAKKGQMWWEILNQSYNFDRSRTEVDMLNTISKEEVVQFYKEHITDSSLRRKLIVRVVSTAKGSAGDKPRETGEARETDKPRETDEARETDKPRETDEARETDKPSETDVARETDKPRETDEVRETDKPSETDEARETDKPRETDEAREPDEARETDKPRETDEARESNEARETDKPRETDEARESNEARETDKPRETDEARETDKPRETDEARETDKPRETDEARETDKARETNEARETDNKNETNDKSDKEMRGTERYDCRR